MNGIKMVFFLLGSIIYIASCDSNEKVMDNKGQAELKIVDSLLRSADYSFEMAETLNSAYQLAAEGKPGDFLLPGEDAATIPVSARDEKIAINLAGFYALECGLGALCELQQKKPSEILEAIVNKTIDSASILLLNRFANATWKAGQPFRDLKRITRPNFIVANFLPPDEIKKDYDQVSSAASKLWLSIRDVADDDIRVQMEKIRGLLQSEPYAIEMAGFQDSSYYSNQQQEVQPFLKAGDDTIMAAKSVKEQKIAVNVAGFYALECGLSYLATVKNILPSDLLKSVINDTISREDKMLLARFANATWKAGQPFRGLSRIKRETFTPFYFLSAADIEKDLVQVRAAAKKMLESL